MELNKVFKIEKGNRTAYWKIIQHPYFPEAFALVADHPRIGLHYKSIDEQHIVAGCPSMEAAEKAAYNHT